MTLKEMMREKEFQGRPVLQAERNTLHPSFEEHREDILPLLRHYLDRYSQITLKNVQGFAQEVLDLFLTCRLAG